MGKDNMVWNYRVARNNNNEEEEFSIREVYYQEDGSIHGITVDAIAPVSESVEGLKEVLQRMLEACEKSVLVTHSLNDSNDMRMPEQ